MHARTRKQTTAHAQKLGTYCRTSSGAHRRLTANAGDEDNYKFSDSVNNLYVCTAVVITERGIRIIRFKLTYSSDLFCFVFLTQQRRLLVDQVAMDFSKETTRSVFDLRTGDRYQLLMRIAPFGISEPRLQLLRVVWRMLVGNICSE